MGSLTFAFGLWFLALLSVAKVKAEDQRPKANATTHLSWPYISVSLPPDCRTPTTNSNCDGKKQLEI
jgi:hypothetical protein